MCKTCQHKVKSIYDNPKYMFYLEKGEMKLEKYRRKGLKTTYTSHVKKRLYQRCISESEIHSALNNGWLIRSKPQSAIILSYTKVGRTYRPIHVVLGYNGDTIEIITAYRPDHFTEVWNDSYDKRI